MRTLIVAALLLAVPSITHAGVLFIGLFGLNRDHATGTGCHTTEVLGPGETARAYEARQRERFEAIDPATVASLRKLVTVAVTVNADDVECVANSGVPLKIVLTEKGGHTPLLTIPLKPYQKSYQNLAGATFTPTNATGQVAAAKFIPLRGRELEFHLVYEDHRYSDLWRSHYAAEVLR
jgi:hypothetical protein